MRVSLSEIGSEEFKLSTWTNCAGWAKLCTQQCCNVCVSVCLLGEWHGNCNHSTLNLIEKFKFIPFDFVIFFFQPFARRVYFESVEMACAINKNRASTLTFTGNDSIIQIYRFFYRKFNWNWIDGNNQCSSP